MRYTAKDTLVSSNRGSDDSQTASPSPSEFKSDGAGPTVRPSLATLSGLSIQRIPNGEDKSGTEKRRVSPRQKAKNSIGKWEHLAGNKNRSPRQKYKKQINYPAFAINKLTRLGKKLHKQQKRGSMSTAFTKKLLTDKRVSKTKIGDFMKKKYEKDGEIPEMIIEEEKEKGKGKENFKISRNHKISDSNLRVIISDIASNMAQKIQDDPKTKFDEEAISGLFSAFGHENPDEMATSLKEQASLLAKDQGNKTVRDVGLKLRTITDKLSFSPLNVRFGYDETNQAISNSADYHLDKDGQSTPTGEKMKNSIFALSDADLLDKKIAEIATQMATTKKDNRPITSDTYWKFKPDKP